MIIIDCPQNSPEWHQYRLGNPGSSDASKIIKPDGNPSKSVDALLDQFFNEVVDGEKSNTYESYDMRKGHEREQESIDLWQMRNLIEVQRPGIIFPDHKRWHISPDGHMPEIRKGIESKNAKATVHLARIDKYNRTKKIDGKHWIQCQMCLSVTGYDSWIYQSYCRNLEPLIVEIFPDFEFIKKLEAELTKFVGKLRSMLKEIGK